MSKVLLSPTLELGFQAWAQDLSIRHDTKLPQTEIIPLVCMWQAVSTHEQRNKTTVREFIDDVMLSDVAVGALVSRLERGEARAFTAHRDTLVPITRYDSYKENGPLYHDFVAIHDGRSEETQIPISAVIICGLIGHASYNSSDGSPLLALSPLGAPESNPNGWKILDFPRVIELTENL